MIDPKTAKMAAMDMEPSLMRLKGLALAASLASLAIEDGDAFHALAGCIHEAHDDIKACRDMLQAALGLQG